jgi:hypothetical protein
MAAPSKIVLGRPRPGPPTEHVFAFGHTDDAPRLVACLADRILKLVPTGSEAASNAALCLAPRTPWRKRLRALESALQDVTDRDEPVFTLWDADALASNEREGFDVERASLLRRDLYRVVRRSAEHGGWVLVRTARTTTTALDELDLALELGTLPGAAQRSEAAERFAPECQPLAVWLVEQRVVQVRDLNLIKETVPDPDAHIAVLVYQELPAAVRDAAKVLSVLRAPQHLNGSFGPVAFAPEGGSLSASSVPVTAREALKRCGFLQPTGVAGDWRMPRVVRDQLYQLARMTLPEFVEQRHRIEAGAGLNHESSVDESVEAHHHAVSLGDIDLAKETARYYGSELAEVARRLSRDAQQPGRVNRKALFLEAAAVYRYIIEHFDATDAYAWEYLGYNLARAGESDEKVLDAYARAHRALPRNPLYHGRWLGYRARRGEDIEAELVDGIAEYAQEDPAREPVSYFTKAVFDGLRWARRADLIEKIQQRHAGLLRALAPNLAIDP